MVDYDGMTTWLVDQGAMVQTFGSSRWCPLKEFMAGQRAAAAEIADQQKSNMSNELPVVYPESDRNFLFGAPGGGALAATRERPS